ncbi:BRCA1-associated RING domain protein 1 [Lunasporangiospora selenospora]|uniref:BRCA1-associated RING domain protein 1 n=1 Tax=Lunasporangiospora selenospora TaxID=979761 RepID=A0A9P6G3G7_9FUNG|nr:BRCA1-associated RING domain protein 1 [Lunasporangiospora selenospora]
MESDHRMRGIRSVDAEMENEEHCGFKNSQLSNQSAFRPCADDGAKVGDRNESRMITCIFTGLRREHRDAFDVSTTRLIEAGLLMEHIPDKDFHESVTHIITSAERVERISALSSKTNDRDMNGENMDEIDHGLWALCPRMQKYLFGMLSNTWIVRYEWFIDSIEAKTWLPLPNPRYLIQGDTQFGPAPGALFRRELRKRQNLRLFESCRVFFYGDFKNLGQRSAFKKQDLLRLVQHGGGVALRKRPTKPSNTKSTPSTPAASAESRQFFGVERKSLYVTEETKPWEAPIDRQIPIIVCDPSIFSALAVVSPLASSRTTDEETEPTGSRSQSKMEKERRTPTPTPTPSSPLPLPSLSPLADIKKHGWLLDHQAVSLHWFLNCISCSVMGSQDLELLYTDIIARQDAFDRLDRAWVLWHSSKTP